MRKTSLIPSSVSIEHWLMLVGHTRDRSMYTALCYAQAVCRAAKTIREPVTSDVYLPKITNHFTRLNRCRTTPFLVGRAWSDRMTEDRSMCIAVADQTAEWRITDVRLCHGGNSVLGWSRQGVDLPNNMRQHGWNWTPNGAWWIPSAGDTAALLQQQQQQQWSDVSIAFHSCHHPQ